MRSAGCGLKTPHPIRFYLREGALNQKNPHRSSPRHSRLAAPQRWRSYRPINGRCAHQQRLARVYGVGHDCWLCSAMTIVPDPVSPDKPFMSDGVNASQTFNSFLTEPQARMNVPDPQPLNTNLRGDSRRLAPGASAIITPPLSRKAMREGPVDYHALSGRLARMLGR